MVNSSPVKSRRKQRRPKKSRKKSSKKSESKSRKSRRANFSRSYPIPSRKKTSRKGGYKSPKISRRKKKSIKKNVPGKYPRSRIIKRNVRTVKSGDVVTFVSKNNPHKITYIRKLDYDG